MIRNYFSVITRSVLSMVGTAIALVGFLLFVTLFLIQNLGFRGGPYLGIITYLLLPAVVVAGLVLVPVGMWRQKKKEHAAEARGTPAPLLPVIDFNAPRTRKALAAFGVMALVGVVVLAVGTYKGVEYMESVEFCGTACHTVMQPEYTAHQRSPHSRVACADCHIGAGADWFVKSKLSGSWQLIAVAFNLYPSSVTGRRNSSATSCGCASITRTMRPTPSCTRYSCSRSAVRTAADRQVSTGTSPRASRSGTCRTRAGKRSTTSR
jgi:hypothetical protein